MLIVPHSHTARERESPSQKLAIPGPMNVMIENIFLQCLNVRLLPPPSLKDARYPKKSVDILIVDYENW